MAKVDLNKYIKKSHITALEKFKAELEQYKKEMDPDGTLYEDSFTPFTIGNIRLVGGCLCYDYDGKPEKDRIVRKEGGEYWEDDIDGIMDTVKFWRKCLRRAKRYWSMDTEKLDKIQDGEIEDTDEEED